MNAVLTDLKLSDFELPKALECSIIKQHKNAVMRKT